MLNVFTDSITSNFTVIIGSDTNVALHASGFSVEVVSSAHLSRTLLSGTARV